MVTIPGGPASNVGDSLKMDYDTYMMNRRPGSTAAGSDGSLLNTSRYGLEVNDSVFLHSNENICVFELIISKQLYCCLCRQLCDDEL